VKTKADGDVTLLDIESFIEFSDDFFGALYQFRRWMRVL